MVPVLLWTASTAFCTAQSGTLTVKVENITTVAGRIHIGIYKDAASFPNKKLAFAGQEVKVGAAGSMEVAIPDLAPGRYAVAVFHDINGNGKLDTNVFGVPTEPYGFSNGALAKWGNPKFEEAAFSYTTATKAISIKLAFWKDL